MNQVLFILSLILQIIISNCGRTCLSCSGVESVRECTEVEVCGNDEFCLSGSSGSVFGKRRAGRHLVCQTCCNGTDICNIKSSCEPEGSCNTSSSHVTKDSNLPRECDDLPDSSSGIYSIYPDGSTQVQVYCIMANNEKWTVIQKRFNGLVDFDRTWEDYKRGFGSVSGEYWLGNDYIHQISASTGHKLSIYLEDFTEHFVYANFSVFDLGNQHRKYQLIIDKFRGSSGISDWLTGAHNTNMFSTKDQDNDNYGNNCAETHSKGGWWYGSCLNANLNGPYMAGPVHNKSAMYWYGWPSSYYSLKKSTMMIKRISERP